MNITKAVEDLSRQFGRPTLGKTVYFLNDDNGRPMSIHDDWESAMDALLAAEDQRIIDDWWSEQSADRRHTIRREFNRLPAAEYDQFRSVAHYGYVSRVGDLGHVSAVAAAVESIQAIAADPAQLEAVQAVCAAAGCRW